MFKDIHSVHVTYCTNYNSIGLSVNDDEDLTETLDDELYNVAEPLVEITGEHCDEDGEYFMNSSFFADDEKQLTDRLKTLFGEDVKITFEFDNIST